MPKLNSLQKKLPLTVKKERDAVVLVNQLLLPGALKFIRLTTYHEAIKAIKKMNVRGAQAIGATGAGGIFLASLEYRGSDVRKMISFLRQAGRQIMKARPTARNLAWGVEQMLKIAQGANVKIIRQKIDRAYQDLLQSEVKNNLLIGKYGASLIKDGDHIETHCNAGSLSAIWFGTATAPMYTAHLEGKKIKVLVDETRPWFQGSRLTAWEMSRANIPYHINIDSANAFLMSHKMVDLIIVGADRITKNGDTANKIGTCALAMVAKNYNIPFYVAAVSATIDFSLNSGKEIRIEDRDDEEVIADVSYWHKSVAPKDAKAYNPVFDVTPAKFISGIITEYGILKPSEIKGLEKKIRREEKGNLVL
jgi:methylthioribose-1-phosphate isomerase